MDFYRDGTDFLQRLAVELARIKLDLSAYELDHLCFRVETMEEYRSWKAQLILEGKLLHEAMIGGRPISTFRLNRSIADASRSVEIIELPSPKKGTNYTTGFEHAEFVIEGDLNAFADHYQKLNFDRSGLDKAHNPEIKLVLTPKMSVKFHSCSLANLVKAESRS